MFSRTASFDRRVCVSFPRSGDNTTQVLLRESDQFVNGFVMSWNVIFSRPADSAVFDQRRARELGRSCLGDLYDCEGRSADRHVVGVERRAYHQGESRGRVYIEHQQAGQCIHYRGRERETRRGVHLHGLKRRRSDELLRYFGCQRYSTA